MEARPEPTTSGHDRPWLMRLGPVADRDASTIADDGQHPGLPPDTLGLALSGEGVRGAAFGLGVLQAMARAGWLERVDYLSTVAGGGYIGAFLGRYFDSYRMRRGEPDPAPGMVQDRVASGLVDPDSAPVAWLRLHSDYLAPSEANDAAQDLVGRLRGLLAFHLVLGALFLAVFGALEAVDYLAGQALARGGAYGAPHPWIVESTPIGQGLPAGWRGPWLAVAECLLWLAVAPLTLAYWLASRELPESFVAPVLISTAIVAGTTLLLAGSSLVLIVLAAAVLWAVASWAAARKEEGPTDERHPFRQMLAHECLNNWLTFSVVMTAVVVAVWAVDRTGRLLAVRLPHRIPTIGGAAQWLGVVVVVVLVSRLVLGLAARLVMAWRSAHAGRRSLWPVMMLVVRGLPLAVAMSFVGHAMYGGGTDYARGLTITVVAAIVSLFFGTREFLPLVNQSGPLPTRAGRLARTFFGAVNPARRVHPEGRDVTRPVVGDELPFDQYQPESVGGPLHLINCAVRESFDVATFRATRVRGAENLAVGPVGVSVARDWHALWTDRTALPRLLRPLGVEAPDPFLGGGDGPVQVEPLGLEDWIAISGAISGPDEVCRDDRAPGRWRALSGPRSGYWWDSGLDARQRTRAPIRGGALAALGATLSRILRGQTLLLSELTGLFGGPWTRHWYLSSGALFESTGAYELLRRRLPFIIVCDAGADPDHRGAAVARLVRLARVDLDAEVTEIGPRCETPDGLVVPAEIVEHLGALGDLRASRDAPARNHAALLRFRFPAAPAGSADDPYLSRRESWMLYVKSTLRGDEPVDVRAHAAAHPGFPDERTVDADFDEQQWECHRRLGEHIGGCLFNKLATEA